MKIPLLFAALTLALFASSCRTSVPLDPMTMKQSCRCLPGKFSYGHVCPDTMTTTTVVTEK